MKRKAFVSIFLFVSILSACGNRSDVSQDVVLESETSVTSESRADSLQLSDSENKSDPVDETAESDAEETADYTEENEALFASDEDKAAFDLLGDYYTDSLFHVSGEGWEILEEYELFRKYFFGSWEKDEPMSWETPLVIDDSESAWLAEEWRNFFFIDFYKVSEDVLSFRTGSAAGASLYWLDINDPDTLYEAEGSPGESPNGFVFNENGFPDVWILHKNDTDPNEPENNYLSVFRLREMAQKYGIDYELLVNVELDAIPWTGHDSQYYFYPMYLVSEADDRIEINTWAGDVYSYDVGIRIILQKIDRDWTREVVSVQ